MPTWIILIHYFPLTHNIFFHLQSSVYQCILYPVFFSQAHTPYHLKIDGVTFFGALNLEATFTSLAFSKVEGDISLTLKDEEEAQGTTYLLQIDLTNDSAPDMIDVEGELKFSSNDEYWE